MDPSKALDKAREAALKAVEKTARAVAEVAEQPIPGAPAPNRRLSMSRPSRGSPAPPSPTSRARSRTPRPARGRQADRHSQQGDFLTTA